ncbi:MAG: cupin domain-containing protein [Anaerolineae bacterium]|nr:cupin domain-containing protein [Anaerolineae bacterium]
MQVVKKDQAKVYNLPGRDWYYLIGPLNSEAKNLTFGIAVFTPGSKPGFHVHRGEEEVIYIVKGHGKIVFHGGQEVVLEPGVAVLIPPGVEHGIIAGNDEPLEMVAVFSPPVIPGSYDRG